MEERRGASHYGEELQERATEKAERMAQEGLEDLGWTEAELGARRRGDGAKLEQSNMHGYGKLEWGVIQTICSAPRCRAAWAACDI